MESLLGSLTIDDHAIGHVDHLHHVGLLVTAAAVEPLALELVIECSYLELHILVALRGVGSPRDVLIWSHGGLVCNNFIHFSFEVLITLLAKFFQRVNLLVRAHTLIACF